MDPNTMTTEEFWNPEHIVEKFWNGLKEGKILARKCPECGANLPVEEGRLGVVHIDGIHKAEERLCVGHFTVAVSHRARVGGIPRIFTLGLPLEEEVARIHITGFNNVSQDLPSRVARGR